MKSRHFIGPALGSLLVSMLALTAFGAAGAESLPAASPAGAIIKPTQIREVPPARLRTWKEAEAAAALATARPAPGPLKKPFLTHMGAAAYKDLKDRAALGRGRQAPAGAAPGSAVPLAPGATVLSNPVNFDGVDGNTAGFYPPDTHGAAGRQHFAEVTNDHLDIYLKAAPNTLVKSISTEAWLGATPDSFTDPRLIYDPVNDRWIFVVTQLRDPGSAHQYLYLAVSKTSDPTGDFYINQIDVSDATIGPNTYWDYPQLGMDRNAIIITGDLYDLDTNNYIDSRMFPVAKSLLYNGQAFTMQLFTGLVGTLAPPVVLDDNPNTYLAAADYFTDNTSVTLYTLTNSATSPSLSPRATIPVPTFDLPPYAPQPGTSFTLDTLDARFENASTQIGNSLFQVHTVYDYGLASPRFYEFDTVNKQVIQSGTFYSTLTSYDFNASIVANRYKDVFVTWSSTDPTNSVNAEVRFSGRRHSDLLDLIPSPGKLLYGSATYYLVGSTTDVQRWGDYSAVCLDPADPKGATAWVVNERILSNTNWGSRIGQIGLPAQNGPLPAINLLLLLD